MYFSLFCTSCIWDVWTRLESACLKLPWLYIVDYCSVCMIVHVCVCVPIWPTLSVLLERSQAKLAKFIDWTLHVARCRKPCFTSSVTSKNEWNLGPLWWTPQASQHILCRSTWRVNVGGWTINLVSREDNGTCNVTWHLYQGFASKLLGACIGHECTFVFRSGHKLSDLSVERGWKNWQGGRDEFFT